MTIQSDVERVLCLPYVLLPTLCTLDEINYVSGLTGGCREYPICFASNCAGKRCRFSKMFTGLATGMGALAIALTSFF